MLLAQVVWRRGDFTVSAEAAQSRENRPARGPGPRKGRQPYETYYEEIWQGVEWPLFGPRNHCLCGKPIDDHDGDGRCPRTRKQ